eukprot:SM000007S20834  [mRNA]  locus=s7:409350:410232:- [translate_table: standard]
MLAAAAPAGGRVVCPPALPCRRLDNAGGRRGGVRKVHRRTPAVSAAIDWAALPAWLVKAAAERVYPANPCGDGRYLDPRTRACVYVCRPGYAWDAAAKACVLAAQPAQPSAASMAAPPPPPAGAQLVPPACGDGFVFDAELDACVPYQGGATQKRRRRPGEAALQWLAAYVFGRSESCPVGFYLDPVTAACVPLCAPGYLYDRDLKRCIPISQRPPDSKRPR